MAMTKRIDITQLRIRVAGGTAADARRLADGLTASLNEAAQVCHAPGRVRAVRIRVGNPGDPAELGAAIARAIVGSLR
jgi:hypothetical protein